MHIIYCKVCNIFPKENEIIFRDHHQFFVKKLHSLLEMISELVPFLFLPINTVFYGKHQLPVQDTAIFKNFVAFYVDCASV